MAYQVRPLRQLKQADLSNEVVHFTARPGGMANDQVSAEILAMDAAQRLDRILRTRTITAHQPFHGYYGDPVVCFTEATQAGLAELVQTNRYARWGIGFSKNVIFQHGGGPAFYVRGDEWGSFTTSDLSSRIKAFGTKYWPGADPLPNAPPNALVDLTALGLSQQNEWAHEREWRLPRPDDDPGWHFAYAEVALVVVPDAGWLPAFCATLGAIGEQLAHVQARVL
jgi:hypothetical protein